MVVEAKVKFAFGLASRYRPGWLPFVGHRNYIEAAPGSKWRADLLAVVVSVLVAIKGRRAV